MSLFSRLEGRTAIAFLLATSIICFAPPLHAGPDAANCGADPDVEAITAQRQRFNTAIRQADVETISEVLADGVVLITGTGSEVFLGHDAQLELWSQDFESDQRLVYVRTPTCIDVSPSFPIALEQGRWRGVSAGNATEFARGLYSAKWRTIDGAWRVEVETYMTIECTSSICPAPENRE